MPNPTPERSLPAGWRHYLPAFCAALAAACAHAGDVQTAPSVGDYALSVYAGRLTNGDWIESFGPNTHFIDSDLVVAALGRTVARSHEGALTYELEGQIGKHSGLQDHWEYNLLGAVRWHRLPWSGRLHSSVAAGLGLSYATEVPAAEATLINGASEKLLAYWHLELTLGPPRADWQATLRLHHRSTAYGLFGDDGGSNAITLGVRYAFR
ncbi:MAG: hypothetical protein AB1831_10200 [Pseudomonadota bacterium]